MAGVVVTMSGDEARLFRAMQKVVEQQDKLNNKFKETSKNSQEAGKKTVESFDKSTLSVSRLKASLVSYAAGIAAATSAVQILQSAWRFVKDEQQSAFQQLQRTAPQDRRLLQISGNSQEFDQMRAQADSLASQFGVDRAVVREVIFSAVSENFRDAVPAIIAANQVIDPISAAGVAGQAPALFKGTIGALEAVNLTLKAAQASRLNFEQIAGSLPQAAEGASVSKATAEETLAVLSVLASEFKSGDTAADRIKAFATAAGINEQFAGQGIIAVVEKLQQMDAEGRSKFLGSSAELNVAYVKMSENLSLIKQRAEEFNQEQIAFAAGGGLLASQSAIAAADPRSIAFINEARSRQQMEATKVEGFGVTGGVGAAAANIAEGRLASSNTWARFIGSIIAPEIASFAASAGFNEQQAASIAVQASEASTPALAKLLDAARMLFSAAERLDNASARMGNTTPAARAAASGASF